MKSETLADSFFGWSRDAAAVIAAAVLGVTALFLFMAWSMTASKRAERKVVAELQRAFALDPRFTGVNFPRRQSDHSNTLWLTGTVDTVQSREALIALVRASYAGEPRASFGSCRIDVNVATNLMVH